MASRLPQVHDLSFSGDDNDDPDSNASELGDALDAYLQELQADPDDDPRTDSGDEFSIRPRDRQRPSDRIARSLTTHGARRGRARGRKRRRPTRGDGDSSDTAEEAPMSAPPQPARQARESRRKKRKTGMGAHKMAEEEDWVPIQPASVQRMDRVLGRRVCNPHQCYFCRNVGYNLPETTREDMQKLVHVMNSMVEGADPILTAQDAAKMYAAIRARSEQYRHPYEDSLPEMTAMDILVHMRGTNSSTIITPDGREIETSMLPHNRTPENCMGMIRDMLLEKIVTHFRQGSIDRASADYTLPSGEPALMLDKDQTKVWIDLIKEYRSALKDDPQKMHGYTPAADRVVTNTPQGTLDVQNKRVIGLSAIDADRNQDMITAARSTFENNVIKHRRLLKHT